MELFNAFSFKKGKYISIVGGGGKTTLMFKLAHELCTQGYKCVVMASTHIEYPPIEIATTITNSIPNSANSLKLALNNNLPVAIGEIEVHTGKLCMPHESLLLAAWEYADWILVEADGARKFPIKVPASYEPVILEPSGSIIAVAGLSALGKPLLNVCHRGALAAEILNVPIETLVTPMIMAKLLTSEQGQFKDVIDPSRFTIFLNQADNKRLYDIAWEVASHIKMYLPDCSIVAGSLFKSEIFKFQ